MPLELSETGVRQTCAGVGKRPIRRAVVRKGGVPEREGCSVSPQGGLLWGGKV